MHILTCMLCSGPNCPPGLRRDRIGRPFLHNRVRVLGASAGTPEAQRAQRCLQDTARGVFACSLQPNGLY